MTKAPLTETVSVRLGQERLPPIVYLVQLSHHKTDLLEMVSTHSS